MAKVVEDMSLDRLPAHEILAPGLPPARTLGGGRGQHIDERPSQAGQDLPAQQVAVAGQRLHEVRQHQIFRDPEHPAVQAGVAPQGYTDQGPRDTRGQDVGVEKFCPGWAQGIGQIDVGRPDFLEGTFRTAGDPPRQDQGDDDMVKAVGARTSGPRMNHAREDPFKQQQIIHPLVLL